ncbi:MAG: hypothetical protein COA96_07170 [SAR86 cluster bacterium]|uniref:Serine aminopeptidase S33 domain-containing protein n=1 Tax=SAR86 cluster bacterium TaxID=2030880 RepID=A0A2A5B3E9_9GAMM|nr:MAG: hypothetical protein COA96_07170 [SAR86 cluster bacterium]
MKLYRIITLLLLLASHLQLVRAQDYAFNSAEEAISGWYHTFDYKGWASRGVDLENAQEVIGKIAQSTGEKRSSDFVDSQIEFGPGNWVYEWIQMGDRTLEEAEKLTGSTRLSKLRSALAYYTIGSWPHLGRSDDSQALEKAVSTYMQAGEMMTVPVRHIDLTVNGKTIKAYLHVPAGEGPFPFVINSFGSDVTKEDSFDLFYRELGPRGIGMLAVDMPGIGEAIELSMQDGSDAVMEGALGFLKNADYADSRNIFIVGGSFGGNAAARAFYRLDVRAVVSMCAPLHSALVAPPEVLDGLPKLTIDGVKARYGVLDRPTAELTVLTKQTSLKVQGFFDAGNKISKPLLIVTTNRDPVSPLRDLDMLLESAADSEVIILDMEGHCPPRWAREPMIARWVADKVVN